MLDLTDHIIRKAYCLSLHEYAVLIEIYYLSHNNKFGGWCIKSKDNIAETLDIGRDTVFSAIKKLEAIGLIERGTELKNTIRTTDKFNSVVSARSGYAFSVKTEDEEIKTVAPEHSRLTVGKTDALPSEKPTPTVGKTDANIYIKYIQDNISSKEDTKIRTYGNQDISKMLDALKRTIGIDAFADSSIERNIAKHCVTLMDKLGVEEFRRRLDIILDDGFKRRNCNRIKYVYNEIKGFIDIKSNSINSY